MSLFILKRRDVAKSHWARMVIGFNGEIFISLGENPKQCEITEIEKIAVRDEKVKDECVFIIKDSDYIISFHKLTQIFLDVWVMDSDIGCIIAHQLVSMKFAERYYA